MSNLKRPEPPDRTEGGLVWRSYTEVLEHYATSLESENKALREALEHCADAGSTRSSRDAAAKEALAPQPCSETPCNCQDGGHEPDCHNHFVNRGQGSGGTK